MDGLFLLSQGFTESLISETTFVFDSLLPNEFHCDERSLRGHVSRFQGRDSVGLVFFRILIVPNAKGALDDEAKDRRNLFVLGVGFGIQILLNLFEDLLVGFTEGDHVLEFVFALFLGELLVIGVLGPILRIVTYGQDFVSFISVNLHVI